MFGPFGGAFRHTGGGTTPENCKTNNHTLEEERKMSVSHHKYYITCPRSYNQ